MVDAVLVEWEGALADTGALRRESLLGALADEGVRWIGAALDESCTGRDVHAAARTILHRLGHDDPTLVDLIALRAGRAFTERLGRGITLQPGAAPFIAALAATTRLAVATRAGRVETELFLRLAGLDVELSRIVTADDVLEPPPAPAVFDRARALLGRLRPARAERTVALVDAAAGIAGARAAGLRVLAVGTPAHVALEADGAVDGVDGLTVADVGRLAGVRASERPA